MNGPQQLALPLASRVSLLAEPSTSTTEPSTSTTESQAVPEAVMQAAFAAMARGETHYTDRPGILPLRKLAVDWLGIAVDWLGKHYGLELSADEVTITCGATEARFVSLKQLVGPGKGVFAFSGSSEHIQPAATLLGQTLTHEIDDPSTIGVVYLNSTDDPERIQQVLNQVESSECWIIWDTSVGEPTGMHPVHHPYLNDRVISIGSFSNVLPGWRVGWIAGSKAANKLRAYKQPINSVPTSRA